MEGKERRAAIIEILRETSSPISGGELAKEMQVSRQVIVQDIALLRAVNRNILSTTKGYLLYEREENKVNRCFSVKHTNKQIEDELCTIVDNGGKVLDVIVIHDIYGQIQVDLILSNRQEIREFVEKLQTMKTTPLKELTGGAHLHTVEASSEDVLDKIEEALSQKKYLINLE